MSVRLRLLLSFLALLFVIVFGTLGYHILEGFSIEESLYMTMITVSTVGYREVGELDAAGRAFTIVLIISALTVGAYGLTSLTRYIVGGEIMETLKGRRMEKKIHSLENHVIVAGYGKLGREIARELDEANAQFCVVEVDHDHASAALDAGFLVIRGDASDETILEEAGVKKAYGLVAALTGDASNVMVTITAREMNPKMQIVARGIDDNSVAKLRRAGADRVELPFKISGRRLTTLVLKPGFIEFMDLFSRTFSDDLHMEQAIIPATNILIGKSLKELDLRRVTGGAMIMGIEREDGRMVLHPDGDVRIQPKDRVLVLGTEPQIKKFQKEFRLEA
ncbi:potassium channel protein [bacterium]|nr:potassium channel protein [bacterium]